MHDTVPDHLLTNLESHVGCRTPEVRQRRILLRASVGRCAYPGGRAASCGTGAGSRPDPASVAGSAQRSATSRRVRARTPRTASHPAKRTAGEARKGRPVPVIATTGAATIGGAAADPTGGAWSRGRDWTGSPTVAVAICWNAVSLTRRPTPPPGGGPWSSSAVLRWSGSEIRAGLRCWPCMAPPRRLARPTECASGPRIARPAGRMTRRGHRSPNTTALYAPPAGRTGASKVKPEPPV